MRRRVPKWLKNRDVLIGGSLLLVIVLLSSLTGLITEFAPNSGNILARLKSPDIGSEHHLGTDALGRDIWSRIVYGGRISLLVGFVSVILQGVAGLTIGLIAGYKRGTVDSLLMRLVDIQLSIPFLVLALALSAALGPGLWNVIIVLSLTGWAIYARVARAATLEVATMPYIEAAHALGQSQIYIMVRHVLPNILAPLLITATFQAARMILAEASLSYLGLGVPPSIPTWGGIIASGRDYVTVAWWISTLPGIAIMLTVLSMNLLGNGLRDVLDPKYKG